MENRFGMGESDSGNSVRRKVEIEGNDERID